MGVETIHFSQFWWKIGVEIRFLLKYRESKLTNFPETWKRGSKWRSICSNLHRVSTPPPPPPYTHTPHPTPTITTNIIPPPPPTSFPHPHQHHSPTPTNIIHTFERPKQPFDFLWSSNSDHFHGCRKKTQRLEALWKGLNKQNSTRHPRVLAQIRWYAGCWSGVLRGGGNHLAWEHALVMDARTDTIFICGALVSCCG